MTVKNREKFEDFLYENLDVIYFDYSHYEDELLKQFGESDYIESGEYEYKLSKKESKDKKPHSYYYKVQLIFDDDGQCIDEIIFL